MVLDKQAKRENLGEKALLLGLEEVAIQQTEYC